MSQVETIKLVARYHEDHVEIKPCTRVYRVCTDNYKISTVVADEVTGTIIDLDYLKCFIDHIEVEVEDTSEKLLPALSSMYELVSDLHKKFTHKDSILSELAELYQDELDLIN